MPGIATEGKQSPRSITMHSFKVSTWHGTLLHFDPATGVLNHAMDSGQHPPAQLIIPQTGVGFLLGFSNIDQGQSLVIKPCRVRAEAGPCRVALIEPDEAHYLSAEIMIPGGATGRIAEDRITLGPWETFTLDPQNLPNQFQDEPQVQALLQIASLAPDAAVVLDELNRTNLRFSPAALRLYFTALPHNHSGIHHDLMCKPQAARNLATDQDPWLATGLPDLAAWVSNRDAVAHRRTVPASLDWIAGLNVKPERFGQKCSTLIRSRVAPRRTACVVATARNEGVYLLEWIAYHQAIGFEHFFIYSNDNDDGSDALLGALADIGVITWLNNQLVQPVQPQMKAYAHAFNLLPDILDYEWVLIVDVDEFLILDTKRFRSVRDYLDWQRLRKVDAIVLNWVVYGTFGQKHYDPGQLLTERFTTRFADVNMHIKCMCRPGMFSLAHAHYPRTDPSLQPIFRDSVGDSYRSHEAEFAFASLPRDDTAWVNHYWSKSIEELLAKFSRNRGDMANVSSRSPSMIIEDIATRVLADERGVATAQDTRIARCAPSLRVAVDALRALPGVAVAADAATACFLNKIASLRAAVQNTRFDEALPNVQEALRLLQDAPVPLTMETIGL